MPLRNLDDQLFQSRQILQYLKRYRVTAKTVTDKAWVQEFDDFRHRLRRGETAAHVY
jgi:hypothetical protein